MASLHEVFSLVGEVDIELSAPPEGCEGGGMSSEDEGGAPRVMAQAGFHLGPWTGPFAGALVPQRPDGDWVRVI